MKEAMNSTRVTLWMKNLALGVGGLPASVLTIPRVMRPANALALWGQGV